MLPVGKVKFWINPAVAVAMAYRLDAAELRELARVAEENRGPVFGQLHAARAHQRRQVRLPLDPRDLLLRDASHANPSFRRNSVKRLLHRPSMCSILDI